MLYYAGRTPHGVRGLKSVDVRDGYWTIQSHPAWGAWIEIVEREIPPIALMSHPAWGAWIEIGTQQGDGDGDSVAPRMGCVD